MFVGKKSKKMCVLSQLFWIFCTFLIVVKSCYAGLPWEGPLETVRESLTGPVAKGVCVITVAVTGVMIAMGEGGAAGRKLLQLICGLAMALLAIGFIDGLGL